MQRNYWESLSKLLHYSTTYHLPRSWTWVDNIHEGWKSISRSHPVDVCSADCVERYPSDRLGRKMSEVVRLRYDDTHRSDIREASQCQARLDYDGYPLCRTPGSGRLRSACLAHSDGHGRKALLRSFRQDLVWTIKSVPDEESFTRLTCSTTYFEAPYPVLVATVGSGRGRSGIGPSVGSYCATAPTEDVHSTLIGRSTDAHISTSFLTPAIWSSYDFSGRLKLTVQALWII